MPAIPELSPRHLRRRATDRALPPRRWGSGSPGSSDPPQEVAAGGSEGDLGIGYTLSMDFALVSRIEWVGQLL